MEYEIWGIGKINRVLPRVFIDYFNQETALLSQVHL
jgi:hypothetical protein